MQKNKIHKVNGIAHPLLLLALVITIALGGVAYKFGPSISNNLGSNDPYVAGANTPENPQLLLKNSMFKLQPTLPGEIAKHWLFFAGRIGNVRAEMTRARNTDLAKAEAVRVIITDKPLITLPHLVQRNVPLTPNTTYKLSFVARASKAGNVNVVVKDSGLIKQQIVPTQTHAVQPNVWAKYESVFTTGQFNAAPGAIVSFYFDLPNQSSITLDNMFLRVDGGTGEDPDADNDGVPDFEDECPNLHKGQNPDPDRPGCPLEDTDDPIDTDGDGVLDEDDLCPTTHKGNNPDPDRPGCPMGTDGGKKTKKWAPGHYLAGVEGNFSRYSGNEYRNIKGFRPKITWSALEGPNKGDYHFEVIERMLDELPQGKKLFFMLEDRTFDRNCHTEIPAYLRNPQNIVITDKGNCSVKVWEQGPMTHLIDLHKALGQRFDDDPRFIGIMNQETANPQRPGDKGDDLRRQLIRFHTEVSPYFEKTHIFQAMNHLGNGEEPDDEANQCSGLSAIADAIRPLGHGLTNPDTVIWDALPWNCQKPLNQHYNYPGLSTAGKGDKPKPMYFVFRQNTNRMPIATGPDTSQWENPSNGRMFNGERMNYDNMAKYTYMTAVTGYRYTPSNTQVTPFGANFMFWAPNFSSLTLRDMGITGQTEHDELWRQALIRFINTPGRETTNTTCPQNINCLQ